MFTSNEEDKKDAKGNDMNLNMENLHLGYGTMKYSKLKQAIFSL